jgi:protocatechuate 3,4-dioxygenase beta subunit
MTDRRPNRREALLGAGAVGLGGLLGSTRLGTEPATAAGSCVLSPEADPGPFWLDNRLTRRDIRAGRPGLPLELILTVQNARSCRPIAKADVELWQCDAGGKYSGVLGNTQSFLRGHQRSDRDGRVRFVTVFPGWYPGRTPHIHLKVHVGGDVVHTGQLFFDERVTAAVYRKPPYRARGQAETSHAEDLYYGAAGGSRAVVRLRRRRGRPGLRGRMTLGVATG